MSRLLKNDVSRCASFPLEILHKTLWPAGPVLLHLHEPCLGQYPVW